MFAVENFRKPWSAAMHGVMRRTLRAIDTELRWMSQKDTSWPAHYRRGEPQLALHSRVCSTRAGIHMVLRDDHPLMRLRLPGVLRTPHPCLPLFKKIEVQSEPLWLYRRVGVTAIVPTDVEFRSSNAARNASLNLELQD